MGAHLILLTSRKTCIQICGWATYNCQNAMKKRLEYYRILEYTVYFTLHSVVAAWLQDHPVLQHKSAEPFVLHLTLKLKPRPKDAGLQGSDLALCLL